MFAGLTFAVWHCLVQASPPLPPPGASADPPPPTPPGAPADSSPPAPAPKGLFDPTATAATGDWLGARPALKAAGIDFQLYYNHQIQAVVKGGANTSGGVRSSASIDAILIFDLGKLKLLPESEVLIHGQRNWGLGANPAAGGLGQTNDDADGDIHLHVAQAWFRQHFLDRRVSLTLGFLDFQTIVDRNACANSEDKQFMHQALDNNPMLPLAIGLGANLTLKPAPWYTLTLGAGDAQSVLYKPGFSTAFHDDAAFFGYLENEFNVKLRSPRGPLPGGYRIGMVYDPRDKALLLDAHEHARTRTDEYGYYVSADQMLFREQEASEQGLSVFGRYGYRNSRVNRMNTFWSAGMSYRGLLPGRDQDVLAWGLAAQTASSRYRHFVNETAGTEAVYELYYALQLTPWCTLTPDVQYIHNPGAVKGIDHAITTGIRLRMSF